MEDLQHGQQRRALDRMDAQIEALEGKAATPAHLFAILDARMTLLAARIALLQRLEGK